MKSGLLLFFLATAVTGFAVPSHAQTSTSDDPFQAILARLQSIEAQLSRIEKNQEENRQQQEKILAELDRIRIWVRRT